MDEEQLWIEAKSFARLHNRSTDWAYIIDIYTAMGGYKTRVFFQNELHVMYRLLGVYTDFQDLVIDNNGNLALVPHEEVLAKRKSFDKLGTNEQTVYSSKELSDVIGPVISKGYKTDEIRVYN